MNSQFRPLSLAPCATCATQIQQSASAGHSGGGGGGATSTASHKSSGIEATVSSHRQHELSCCRWRRTPTAERGLERSKAARCVAAHTRALNGDSNSLFCADHMCDMAFDCNLMADPVVASDGFTYERWAMEQW